MRRKLSLVIAFIGVLGLVGFAPAAQADHDSGGKNAGDHEHAPAPPVVDDDATCVVAGEVDIDDSVGNGGVPTALSAPGKNHNHFRFSTAQIQCTSDNPHLNKIFDVDAAGGTDGQGDDCGELPGKAEQCLTNHGEQLTQGWSHGSCYDDQNPKGTGDGDADVCEFDNTKAGNNVDDLYDGTNVNPSTGTQCTNCGEIAVRSTDREKISDPNDPDGDPDATDNWVKFCRGVYDDGHGRAAIPGVGTDCTNAPDGTAISTGGGSIIAWGALTHVTADPATGVADKPTDEVYCFLAQLELAGTPNANQDNKVTNATLVGDAVVEVVDDKGECEGDKKPKPA